MKIRIKSSIEISATLFVNIMLTTVLYYFSYRYICKYANAVTSGTYYATPFSIQVAKYVLIAGVSVWFFLYILSKRVNGGARRKVLGSIALLFAVSCYDMLILKEQGTIVLALALLIMLLLVLSKDALNLKSIDHVFKLFLAYCSVYEMIQLFLYFTRGRLPAIAWGNAGIFYVRFGGAFDDPFAFSIMLSFLIPYAYYRYCGKIRYLYSGMLLLFLIMTWTMTTTAVIIGVFSIAFVYNWMKNKKMKSRTALLFLFIITAGLLFMMTKGATFFKTLLQAKSGSITEHISSISLDGITLGSIIGIIPQVHYSEASFIKMLFQSGLLFAIMFYILGFYCVEIAFRNIRRYKLVYGADSPVLYGMAFYLICFLVASTNIPYVYQFMPMILYAIFAGLEIVLQKQLVCNIKT